MTPVLTRAGLGAFAGSLLAGVLAVAGTAVAAPPSCAATLPYAEAVARTDRAARAVLARAGRESCLRGKLTNALLGLSRSCEKEGRSEQALCSLADRAVVVTPMTVAFMEDTSRELLRLIAPGTPVSVAPGRSPAEAEPDPNAMATP
jgi:hypothetical protein